MARDRKLSEKIRGILHLRAAPTPRPTLRKDGLIPASLAHEQPACEVFSIGDLPLWALVPTLPRLPILLWSAGYFHHVQHSRTCFTRTLTLAILTVACPWGEELRKSGLSKIGMS